MQIKRPSGKNNAEQAEETYRFERPPPVLVATHNQNPYRSHARTGCARSNSPAHDSPAHDSPAPMPADQSLHQSDYRRLAEFRYHLRCFLKFSEHAAAQKGLSPQQHQALLAIKGAPGGHITISILAERLGIRHNSAVELIDRLIANGLAERRQNPQDRREVFIDLTNRAERMLAKLSLAHRNEARKLAPLLRRLLVPFQNRPRKGRQRKRKI